MDWNEFLREAIAEKEVDLVREALAQGADPNWPEEDTGGSFTGRTPLFWAVSGGNLEIARLLLDAGARVAAESKAGSSSLHSAASHLDLPMINLLLEHDGSVALNWFDEIDATPLMCAIRNGSVVIARRLIEAGADVNACHATEMGGNLGIVYGYTALIDAAAEGNLEMVKLLVKAGANPTLMGWMGVTPLDKAEGRKRGDGPRIYELLEQAVRRF